MKMFAFVIYFVKEAKQFKRSTVKMKLVKDQKNFWVFQVNSESILLRQSVILGSILAVVRF
jgi:hypothetical protein